MLQQSLWSDVVCQSVYTLKHSFKATGPNRTKNHIEPSWFGETEVFSNGDNHVTKMAIISINCKNYIFFLESNADASLVKIFIDQPGSSFE